MENSLEISFKTLKASTSGPVVLLYSENTGLSASGLAIDQGLKGALRKTLKSASFTGAREKVFTFPTSRPDMPLVIVVGLGKQDNYKMCDVTLLGGAITGALLAAKQNSAVVIADWPGRAGPEASLLAASLAAGAALRNYVFAKYKTRRKEGLGLLSSLVIKTAEPAAARRAYVGERAVVEGNHLARDLINEPANILTPAEFAKRARALARLGVKVEILDVPQMRRLGMGALLGVAQGSVHTPRLVVMRWQGGRPGTAPVVLVGKGVTFDTGGVSIKPAAGMEEMKGDMAGAAAVTGTLLALARRKARANVVGMIGLVENAVDGGAQRPGDIVVSMSGQTIAVLNTDAEGRLVLADALWYAQQRFKPRLIVDLATLTGAILVALGKDRAGLFSNDDDLATKLTAAGEATSERLWRLPMGPEYDKLIDHDVADMKNIGGRFANSITAAQFLQRFVVKTPWAHLDIVGTAIDSPKTAINQGWTSGWGVRLLNELIHRHYEG